MHGLFLAACSWIVFALIGLFCAEAFLSLFASDAEIMAMGVSYMQICTIARSAYLQRSHMNASCSRPAIRSII